MSSQSKMPYIVYKRVLGTLIKVRRYKTLEAARTAAGKDRFFAHEDHIHDPATRGALGLKPLARTLEGSELHAAIKALSALIHGAYKDHDTYRVPVFALDAVRDVYDKLRGAK